MTRKRNKEILMKWKVVPWDLSLFFYFTVPPRKSIFLYCLGKVRHVCGKPKSCARSRQWQVNFEIRLIADRHSINFISRVQMKQTWPRKAILNCNLIRWIVNFSYKTGKVAETSIEKRSAINIFFALSVNNSQKFHGKMRGCVMIFALMPSYGPFE